MAIDDDSLDFDLLAASLRADATDLSTFIEALAAKLETALPAAVQVKRGREGLRGPKLVKEIVVQTGDVRLELRRQGHGIESLRARTSGGIVLKTERLDIDAWLETLTQILEVESQRSQLTRQALARLLEA